MSLVYDALKQERSARMQSGAPGAEPATQAPPLAASAPATALPAAAEAAARPPAAPQGGQALQAHALPASSSLRPVMLGAMAGGLAVVALVVAFVWGQSSRTPEARLAAAPEAPAIAADASPPTPARPVVAAAPASPPPPALSLPVPGPAPAPAPAVKVAAVPAAAAPTIPASAERSPPPPPVSPLPAANRSPQMPAAAAVPAPEPARSTVPSASPETAAPVPVAAAPAAPARPASLPKVQVSSGAETGIDVADLFREFLMRVQASQWAEAQATQQRVMAAMGPDHIVSLRMQAFLALRTDRLDAAKGHYLKLVDRLPQDREAGMNLALIEWRQGDKDAARKRLIALSDHYPNDADVRALMQNLRQ